MLTNLIKNSIKQGYFKVMFSKIFKRFEKNSTSQATRWAKKNIGLSTEDFCKLIDKDLWNETIFEMRVLEKDAENILSKINFSLGGGGNYYLLYFLIRKTNPKIVVETGVAAGWSSLCILRAFKKSGFGKLYSSDFPYFRLKDPEKYIGVIAKNETNLHSWDLDFRGDKISLPSIKSKLGKGKIDLFHYDSDKSYSGRLMAINILKETLSKNAIIIFDDIQNNMHFHDFVKKEKIPFSVLEFEEKYIGIASNLDILKSTTLNKKF